MAMCCIWLCCLEPIAEAKKFKSNSASGSSSSSTGGKRKGGKKTDKKKKVQKDPPLSPNQQIKMNGTLIDCTAWQQPQKDICSCEYILCRKQKKCKLATTTCTLLNNPKTIDYMNCRAGVNIQGRKDCHCLKTKKGKKRLLNYAPDGSPIYGIWMPNNVTYNGEPHSCEGKGTDEIEECDCPTLLCRQDTHACKDGEKMCRLRRDPTIYSMHRKIYTNATDRDCRCKSRKINLDQEEDAGEEGNGTKEGKEQAKFYSSHKTKYDL